MNCRLLAVVLLVVVFGTRSHAQEPAADSVPATVPGNSGGGLATELGFGGSGFGGEDEFGHAMGLPASAIPGRKWVAGAKVVVALSDDGKQVFAYSERHPRWTPQDLEPMEGTVAVPVVGEDVATVRHAHFCYAYSTKLGTWDVLTLPKGEVAIPQVGTDSVTVHSASQGDFVFKDAWGKWFSTDEIKAGRVAEYLAESSRDGSSDGRLSNAENDQRSVSILLKYVEAETTARMIRQLLNRPGGKPLVVDPSDQFNQISLYGDTNLVRQAEALIKSLDVPEPSSSASETISAIQDRSIAQRVIADLDRQSRSIADNLKRRPLSDPAEAKKLQALLHDVVERSFTTRQEMRRAELELFAKRLQALKQSVELRDRIAAKIIDRRIEELLDPNLSWESSDDSTSAVDVPNGVPRGHTSAAGEQRLWHEYGVTPAPVSDLTAKVLEALGVHLSPMSNTQFRGKNVLTKYLGGLGLTFVQTGGPAEKAGIHGEHIVVALQGQGVATLREFDVALQDALKNFTSGTSSSLAFDVLRNGETVRVNVPLPDGTLSLAREMALSEDLKVAQRRLEICASSELSADEAATVVKSEHSRQILYLHDGGGQVIPLRRKPETLLNETDVVSAVAEADPEIEGAYNINLELKPEAAQRFAEETRRLSQQASPVRLAILVSGKIRSAPRLVSEIPNGKIRITGKFTKQEAEQLAADLIRNTDPL